MADLFIIEAPGKRQTLQQILQKIGVDAKVEATKGHLFDMPDQLTPLGIDVSFRDFKRSVKNPELVEWLRKAVKEARNVYVGDRC